METATVQCSLRCSPTCAKLAACNINALTNNRIFNNEHRILLCETSYSNTFYLYLFGQWNFLRHEKSACAKKPLILACKLRLVTIFWRIFFPFREFCWHIHMQLKLFPHLKVALTLFTCRSFEAPYWRIVVPKTTRKKVKRNYILSSWLTYFLCVLKFMAIHL